MSVYPPEKQFVVSVGISKTSYGEVVSLCRQWAVERSTRARYICVTNAYSIMLAKDNPELAKIFNDADIATPDGMPVVWALRTLGAPQQQRVYGPTLMLNLCRAAAEDGFGIFLYGGRPQTLPALEKRLFEQFPGLRIAGSYAPPFRALLAGEEEEVRARIQSSGARIVFVGIGTPKQEQWMYEHRECFPCLTLIGVGAAFDFFAGRTKQAPAWMQRHGFEWFFRLMTEPARLWRRYLIVTPRFLPLWGLQLLRTPRFRRSM